MNKENLAEAVMSKVELATKRQAQDVVEAVFGTIQEALSKGEDVVITGFGTFSVKKRSARQGRNPKTGEKLSIPASKAPKFKAGKNLKEAVK